MILLIIKTSNIMNKILDVIKVYIYLSQSGQYHRYKSWDRCFEVFKSPNYNEYHTLELAFYLASWGMYRGSSMLLQKNHMVHQDTIKILYNIDFSNLKCNKKNEVTNKLKDESISKINQIKSELSNHYIKNGVSPTDTLLSKILLGTLGCVPAFDDYFVKGIKKMEYDFHKFELDSLHKLFQFAEDNKSQIRECQKYIEQQLHYHYPAMKIIDMYFWQIGYDEAMKEKNLKKKNSAIS